ncbi:hypothetical protein ZIOFF_035958 [Zingiber officinale]|uniref:Uncharacterized protein n=1 Tax=Zingiber officinale TaxID=94328 RepID=A0A8J5GD90_ZINOF|nr:hypothetical protein ZIOFF_035958 [Zingiber officinale]
MPTHGLSACSGRRQGGLRRMEKRSQRMHAPLTTMGGGDCEGERGKRLSALCDVSGVRKERDSGDIRLWGERKRKGRAEEGGSGPTAPREKAKTATPLSLVAILATCASLHLRQKKSLPPSPKTLLIPLPFCSVPPPPSSSPIKRGAPSSSTISDKGTAPPPLSTISGRCSVPSLSSSPISRGAPLSEHHLPPSLSSSTINSRGAIPSPFEHHQH